MKKKTIYALGFFDGVHIAHRNLISRAKDIAVKNNLQLGIFTFKSDGNIKSGSERLYDDKEKSEMFESLGADFVFFADFDAISGVSAEDFVKKMLVDDIGCKICVAGFNFRFGKGASGKATDLCKLMQESNGEAIICEEIKANDETTLSASLIRDLIKNGEIKSATEMLGAPYYIKGRVLEYDFHCLFFFLILTNLVTKTGNILRKSMTVVQSQSFALIIYTVPVDS